MSAAAERAHRFLWEHGMHPDLLDMPAELAKLRAPIETFFLKRDRGAGRPTKKDRRQMEALWDDLSFDVPDDIAESFAADFGLDD